MYSNDIIKGELKRQLAIDLNCKASDFDKKEDVITISAKNEGRREYSDNKSFFLMATTGKNAVISADKKLHTFLNEFVKDKNGFWLFDYHNLLEIEKMLLGFGKKLSSSHHMFLPDTKPLNIKPDFEVKWFNQEEIHQFYGDKRFPNAFCEKYEPKRPDILAVSAVIDGEIAGMAGCSADSKKWWQIGIDVMPEYRGNGIGTTLVGLLKDEIFNRGAIPFYGTCLSNIHSQNIALNCGFYPYWVEIESRDK